MRAVDIYRDKFRQSYYNDKHQDELVIEDRKKYITVMDELALRQPLWLQLTTDEFAEMKERMPSDGFLVHHYDAAGTPMVEVHVDLDDSFDAKRAALPLGGSFSVRFPGRLPHGELALTHPPAGLPSPGADLTRVDDSALNPAEPVGDAHADTEADSARDGTNAPPAIQKPPLPTIAAINKMKVHEMRMQLRGLGLPEDGTRPVMLQRLAEAVRAAAEERAAAERAAAEDSDSDADAEEWKVKRILGRRVVTQLVDDVAFDVVEYQVEWDYPDPENPTQDEVTWEKESNLSNAAEALHEFLAMQPIAQGCHFGHINGVCRCALPLIHIGQDESIFKAYQQSQYQWVVQGIRGLRKKTDGPGEMVSGFKDELRGFGHPLTKEELAALNRFRKARGKEPLTSSPAVRFLSYGKHKDGWTYEHFAAQVEDILDMYETIYPNAQVLLEVDWSSGHSKHREDALNVLSMSVNFGGKQSIPHPSKMVEGCVKENAILKLGDLQYFYFRSAEERRATGATDGLPDPPPFYKPADLPAAEYIGKAKGKKQILFERGMWIAGMIEKVDDDDQKGRDRSLSMDHVLGSCPDFYNETSALQTYVESRGHILVMSPKGHCELAGACDDTRGSGLVSAHSV